MPDISLKRNTVRKIKCVHKQQIKIDIIIYYMCTHSHTISRLASITIDLSVHTTSTHVHADFLERNRQVLVFTSRSYMSVMAVFISPYKGIELNSGVFTFQVPVLNVVEFLPSNRSFIALHAMDLAGKEFVSVWHSVFRCLLLCVVVK